MSNRYQRPFCVIAIIFLLLAVFPLPYGFYTLIRIIVTIAALLMAHAAHNTKRTPFVYLFGILAILFNPIIKIHFDKGIWMVLDIIGGVIFIIWLLINRKRASNNGGN